MKLSKYTPKIFLRQCSFANVDKYVKQREELINQDIKNKELELMELYRTRTLLQNYLKRL